MGKGLRLCWMGNGVSLCFFSLLLLLFLFSVFVFVICSGRRLTYTTNTSGWDHGVFVPFLLINPAADIPIVQVSVLSSEDPAAHLRMGRALAQLRDSNVAIVGSGSASLHNLRLMFAMMSSDGQSRREEEKKIVAATKEFNAVLTDAITSSSPATAAAAARGGAAADDQEERREREKVLEGWRGFPSAYTMHPRGGAEHFLPLLVCCGAGGGRGKGYVDGFYGVDIWSYYWE